MSEFLFLIEDLRGEPAPEKVGVEEMVKWTREMRAAGQLAGGSPPLLPESQGARVRVRGGRTVVTDGPFTETKEIICGYNVVRAASRDEAVELAKRVPYARAGQIEVRQAGVSAEVGAAPGMPRFLILLREGDAPEQRDGNAEYRDMMAYVDALKREGRYVESAGLPRQARAARVQVREGRALVSDGPFAESKELVGGLVLVAAHDRDEAIALAARCPHVTWGSAEVRGVRPMVLP